MVFAVVLFPMAGQADRPVHAPELLNASADDVQDFPDPQDIYVNQISLRLNSATISDEEIADCLISLGKYPRSPQAIARLIYYLEFELAPKPWGPQLTETPIRYLPAVDTLRRIGRSAVPNLVREYLFFFDNYDLGAKLTRWSTFSIGPDGKREQRQSPLYRLNLLLCILVNDKDTSRFAVEVTLSQMTTPSDQPKRRLACISLIREIIAQYSESDRGVMFPPQALQLLR